MKIANHHDKQLTPLESSDQDNFFSLCLGYHQILNFALECLQQMDIL